MSIKPISPRAGEPAGGGGGGSGDVVGPGSSTADSLAQFSGTTGKLLKDGLSLGTTIGNVPQVVDVGSGIAGLDVMSGRFLTDVLNPVYVKVIESEADLPTPVAGLDPDDAGRLLHPLDAYTAYYFDLGPTGITLTTGMHLPGNNLIYSFNVEGGTLSYTGTEKMFVISGTSQITDITMDCPTGTHMDARGVGVFVGMTNVRITTCLNMGYLECGFWIVRSGGYLSVTGTGFTHAGANWVRCAASNWVEVISAATPGHDLGTTTYSFFLWDNCDLITADAGASSFSGLASSGNIVAGGKGGFSDIRFSGVGTPQVGIDPNSDIRWRNTNCTGVLNSVNSGMLEFEDNALTTTINTAGVWEDVNATFTEAAGGYLYEENSNGVLESVSEDTIKGKIAAAVSVRRASGSAAQAIKLGIFQDSGGGFTQIGSAVCIDVDNTSSELSILVNVTAATGDLFKMQIQKPNDTTDVICICGQLSAS